MVWPLASSSGVREHVALGERRQQRLAVVELGVGVVGALDVGPEVAGERDRAARRSPLGVAPVAPRVAARRTDTDCAAGVGHLRGDRALPDQVVEAQLVAAQLAASDSGVRNESPAGRIASCASWAFLTLRS